jgi:hypothetical protein
MAHIICQVKLQETPREIQRLIIQGITDTLNDVMRNSCNAIQSKARTYFTGKLLNNPVWQSLDGGKLQAEFGIPKEQVGTNLQEILEEWCKQIVLDYKPARKVGPKWTGGIKVGMIETDWQKIITCPGAVVITKSGWGMRWLEWLLTYGDRYIVEEYKVVMINSPRSRSGMALMRKDTSRRWRVPPEFSGTTNNNFMTKLLETMSNDIDRLVEDEITKRL